MTKILTCYSCKAHQFQDKTYGEKMRVMNYAPGKGSREYTNRYRCTVCGQTRTE